MTVIYALNTQKNSNETKLSKHIWHFKQSKTDLNWNQIYVLN